MSVCFGLSSVRRIRRTPGIARTAAVAATMAPAAPRGVSPEEPGRDEERRRVEGQYPARAETRDQHTTEMTALANCSR